METKKSILIIDDQEDFVFSIRFYLENANFRVDSAPSGEQGIVRAAELQPDLILLDLNMPGINGHETCRRLKKDARTASIPVMMLSSQSSTIEKVEALDLGACDYLCKLFPLEEILARIRVALRPVAGPDSRSRDLKSRRVMELRKIIDEKSFKIHFQPIIELSSKKIFAYEALCHPPEGSIFESATALFTHATELDLFTELDNAARRVAAQKASAFLQKDQMLFLNVDANILGDRGFMELDFLKETSIKPSQLCFEITERVYIQDFQRVTTHLLPFKEMGIQFAVDDVGEGYSSLKAIAVLNPDFLKIDIAIVRGVEKDPVKELLVQTIVGLSRKIGSFTLAEGVETEAEHEKMTQLGGDYGQGYLYGRPQLKD